MILIFLYIIFCDNLILIHQKVCIIIIFHIINLKLSFYIYLIHLFDIIYIIYIASFNFDNNSELLLFLYDIKPDSYNYNFNSSILNYFYFKSLYKLLISDL